MGTVPHHSKSLAPLAILVMGVSGSGKSTLGAELSVALGCPYLEGDAFHTPEAIAKMRAGEPLSDDDRWPWLDRIGDAVNAEVAGHGVVVAACSALRRAYRNRLRAKVAAPLRFVLLEGEREELSRRLSNRPGHYMPASLLTSQLETLEHPDPDEHGLILDALESPAVLRDQVVAWLYGPGH